jgi:hypothetical protein
MATPSAALRLRHLARRIALRVVDDPTSPRID